MGKVRTVLSCRECGQQLARWAGRCPGCGAWGTIEEGGVRGSSSGPLETLAHEDADERRVSTGLPGIDRVLGGGLVPSTVALLAGEPGIGKSTLLLQMAASLSAAGLPCLFASGEESRRQVSARAHRLGIDGSILSFVTGRELPAVVEAARSARPFLLAVDSIQALRDPSAGQVPGGPSQVRGCADALVGFAKGEGISVLVTGHVTKDGDLAGPRALEHAVDVVLSFDGDPRSGLRMLSAGKNRFGAEGEVAWFEMTGAGLREIDPGDLLLPGGGEPGAATALPLAGRRALAVEVQALVARGEGTARRQASGLDLRRFQLVGAVLDSAGLGLGRSDVFGAVAGGARLDDPACDLAVAAAVASAAAGVPAPTASAFVGEIGLTGVVRPAPG
ncbi:MAG TPA: ATPase domain-containing protein, partial [Actinomycetota bacterium]